ncbi:hypothetical protein [Micromonospora sp. NPDC002575]|uniref:hypothetical protein n=1 Tax=Micromonospora sp. NPDC002575 TaxID=3364222 RepID=UPI00367F603A
MSSRHAQRAFRRRPSALILALGLALGLITSTALTSPASARPTAQAADPLCYADAFSQPPGIGNPTALAWWRVGNRSTGGYTYRYWMVQDPTGSTWYYRSSYVAKCSGDSLLSSTEIPTSDGFGTAACTSSADRFPAESEAERYVGQRASWDRGYISQVPFRYWQREWFSYATLRWVYSSAYVVRC